MSLDQCLFCCRKLKFENVSEKSNSMCHNCDILGKDVPTIYKLDEQQLEYILITIDQMKDELEQIKISMKKMREVMED